MGWSSAFNRETWGDAIKIVGVKNVCHYSAGGHIEPLFEDKEGKGRSSVVLQDGVLVCVGDVDSVCGGGDVDEFVDLEEGSLAPGLTSYGSSLKSCLILLRMMVPSLFH